MSISPLYPFFHRILRCKHFARMVFLCQAIRPTIRIRCELLHFLISFFMKAVI